MRAVAALLTMLLFTPSALAQQRGNGVTVWTDAGVRAIAGQQASTATVRRRARVELAVARELVEVRTARLATEREAERRMRARLATGAATAVDMGLAERESALAEADLANAR